MDLLTHDPSSLSLEDVRGTISDKLVVQMVAKKASVAQMVGASVRVTSLERYLSILSRVLTSLGLQCGVVDWLTGKGEGATTCWIKPEQLAELTRLFESRHQLVHELGVETMGHPNIRDAWSPSEADKIGGTIASLMFGVEAAFTKIAPPLFPNVLDEERWPISSTTQLSNEFERLDALADEKVLTGEWNYDQTVDRWQESRRTFREYLEAEHAFIDTANMLHWRYFDARTPLRVRLLRYRIDFLEEVLSHFHDEEPDSGECGKFL